MPDEARLVAAILLALGAGCAAAPAVPPPPPAAAAKPAPVHQGVLMLLDAQGTRWGVVDAKDAAALLAVDITAAPYRPEVPPELATKGVRVSGDYQVCVGPDGQVVKVDAINSTHRPDIDTHWIQTMKRWHYRPYVRDGVPTRFCTQAHVEALAP